MTRRVHNWSYRDVRDFLKANGFSFYKEVGGSHQQWIKRSNAGGVETIVELNFTHKSYPPKTLEGIIRKSGIAKDDWFKWASA